MSCLKLRMLLLETNQGVKFLHWNNFENRQNIRNILAFLVREIRKDPFSAIDQMDYWNEKLVANLSNEEILLTIRNVEDEASDPETRTVATLFRSLMVDRLIRQDASIQEMFREWVYGEYRCEPSKN